jgi:hypothetical protein
MTHHCFGHEEHRKDVSAKSSLQLLLRDLGNALLRVLLCGVVDQDVDAAEFSSGSLNRIFTKLLATNVAGEQQAFAPFSFDQPLRFPGIPVLVEINDGDVRTFLRQKNCNGTANSAVTAGDQRDFTPQFLAANIFAGTGARLRPHFVLTTRLPSLVLRRPNFIFLWHPKEIFAARECLSRVHL